MFKDISKVKRYNYEVVVEYEVTGKSSNFPWVKVKKHIATDTINHRAEYADFDLENLADKETVRFLSFLQEQYSNPEYIANTYMKSFTWYKEKPIFRIQGFWIDDCQTFIVNSVDDIKLKKISLNVTSVKELHELSYERIKEEVTIDDFFQIIDYGKDQIAIHKTNPTEKPHISELPF